MFSFLRVTAFLLLQLTLLSLNEQEEVIHQFVWRSSVLRVELENEFPLSIVEFVVLWVYLIHESWLVFCWLHHEELRLSPFPRHEWLNFFAIGRDIFWYFEGVYREWWRCVHLIILTVVLIVIYLRILITIRFLLTFHHLHILVLTLVWHKLLRWALAFFLVINVEVYWQPISVIGVEFLLT